MFQIDFYLYLLIVFFGVLVATDGQQTNKQNIGFKCSDVRLVDEIHGKLKKCLIDKWQPLPPHPADWDIRRCCFYYEDHCVWNKLVLLLLMRSKLNKTKGIYVCLQARERCKVTEEVFAKDISRVLEDDRQSCLNQGIEYTVDICHSQHTNDFKDRLCGRYMPCSMSDPIPSPLPELEHKHSKDTNDSNTIVFEFKILFLSFVLIHSLYIFFY